MIPFINSFDLKIPVFRVSNCMMYIWQLRFTLDSCGSRDKCLYSVIMCHLNIMEAAKWTLTSTRNVKTPFLRTSSSIYVYRLQVNPLLETWVVCVTQPCLGTRIPWSNHEPAFHISWKCSMIIRWRLNYEAETLTLSVLHYLNYEYWSCFGSISF